LIALLVNNTYHSKNKTWSYNKKKHA